MSTLNTKILLAMVSLPERAAKLHLICINKNEIEKLYSIRHFAIGSF